MGHDLYALFIIKNSNNVLESLYHKTQMAATDRIEQSQLAVLLMQETIKTASIKNFKNAELALAYIEKNIQIMDPVNVLKRGFSITYHNGKAEIGRAHV